LPADKKDLASPIPWRRSLRASQARRAAAARRRRMRLRGRAGITLVLALTAGLAGTALAAGDTGGSDSSLVRSGARGDAVRAIQTALGLPADGVYGPRTRLAVRDFQRAHGLEVDGLVGPQTLAALGITPSAAAQPRAAGAALVAVAPDPELARIAQCESGGDPTAVSANGHYRGKYQFTRATWRAVGGSGDPAAAPEPLQDELAAKLLAQRGTAPWPVCSRA
jgi:hypothetical protein